MFKFILGAAVVVGLVGYGVITTEDVEMAGDKMREGLNYVFEKGAEATSNNDTLIDQAKELARDVR